MKYLTIVVALTLIICASGCGETIGPISPGLVDRLAGTWSGVLNYTESEGIAVPMSLALDKEGSHKLSAIMTTGAAVYEDTFVAEVNENIVMNFDVAGETWELVLEGQLTDSTFAGNIIRREAGEDDILLGTWAATPAS